MRRRQLLKTITQTTVAGIAMNQLPFALAQDKANVLSTVWGAPVAPSILLAVAAQQGQLQQSHPYNVEVWKTPDQLRAGVAKGTMPVTMVPSYVAANFANRGKDVVLGNIMTNGLLYMVAHEQPLTSLEDLVGKSIVMPFKNDMPDLVLQILCKNAGVDFTALDVQYVATPPEAIALFLKQRAEIAYVPEPLTTAAILKGKKAGLNVVRALDMQQQWGKVMNTEARIPQAGMQIERGFYEANQDIIEQLFTDISAAVDWVDENPEQAATLGTEYIAVPQPILQASLPNANLTGERTSDIVDEILFFFEQMYQLNPKIVGGKMPGKDLFG